MVFTQDNKGSIQENRNNAQDYMFLVENYKFSYRIIRDLPMKIGILHEIYDL